MYSKPQIIVIAGAPGSGKSTFVDKVRKPGDIVWDMDKVIQALTGLPLYQKPDGIVSIGIAIKDTLLKELNSFNHIKKAWFILSAIAT